MTESASLDGVPPLRERRRMAVNATPAPLTLPTDEPDIAGLVIEDDTPVDSIVTEKQERLLTDALYSSWSGPPPARDGQARPFAAFANVGLFSSSLEPPVVPDVMLSLDVSIPGDQTEKKNRSYFMWRYGKPPEVVIELVSHTPGAELTEKFERYRKIGVAHYIVYDPLGELGNVALRAFELRGGLYVVGGHTWFEAVGLGLIEWDGVFEGFDSRWLRWCTRDGSVIPTGAERALAAGARASTAEARAERLLAKLRAAGIDPNGDG